LLATDGCECAHTQKRQRDSNSVRHRSDESDDED
jgi:hypothetical protein